jgi:hypothetical protein
MFTVVFIIIWFGKQSAFGGAKSDFGTILGAAHLRLRLSKRNLSFIMFLTITETSDGKKGYEAIFGEFSLSKIYLMHL